MKITKGWASRAGGADVAEQDAWVPIMNDKKWALPAEPGIKLDQGELLLLDWVLCGASRAIPNADIGYLLEKWHEFRLDIWRGIKQLKAPDVNEVGLALIDLEARALLAVVPTTFRWGNGPDCGYTLKNKLANFLLGDIENDYETKTHNASADKPTSGSAA